MKYGKAKFTPHSLPASSDRSSHLVLGRSVHAIMISCQASPVADLKQKITTLVSKIQDISKIFESSNVDCILSWEGPGC